MRVFNRLSTSVFFAIMSLLLSGNLAAKDFIALQQDLNRYSEALEAIEQEAGRYGIELVESLHSLSRTQLQANLFEDARNSIDRAVQIVRFSEGLYSPVQYSLLQTEIEIELEREYWEKVNEKLEHYTWLISKKYEGQPKPRLENVRWIASVHLAAFKGDSEEMQSEHLADATFLRETAVQYAQVRRLTKDPLYTELLFELAGAYRAEVDAIREGGSTSYHLRLLFPGLDIVQDKREAIDRRYRVGLEKLEMLQTQAAVQDNYSAKKEAVIQMYIADWHGYFGFDSAQEQMLNKAVESLVAANATESEIDTYLSNVGNLSWQRLDLDLQPMTHNTVAAAE